MAVDTDTAAQARIVVDDGGALTLFIGDSSEPAAEDATNIAVLRILMDHAERLERDLTVATKYPSGHQTYYTLKPDGTMDVETDR
ncbi:hypothetical protein G1H10_03740 [Phytoactinopolyspora halotolerans]|uniref:Uncharacterized protein n=2 Tax=Phytoactinopolyspora halotolerans TaxID=1981512 RepID=A0A6L9S3P2_9ACTN|nr:hypothetical protein [Phytoactinopolyspora halotolerans]